MEPLHAVYLEEGRRERERERERERWIQLKLSSTVPDVFACHTAEVYRIFSSFCVYEGHGPSSKEELCSISW